MSSWVDDLKQQAVRQEDIAANSNAIRLHNARMVRAKAPDLWTVLIAQIDSDLKRLMETFPNDIGRQGDLIRRGNSYVLQGKKLPISVIKLTLNLDGSCIDIAQAQKQDFAEHQALMPSKPIDFVVTKDEDVTFFWKNWSYADPALLSEQLVKLACRLH
jgi:hypothetical protein